VTDRLRRNVTASIAGAGVAAAASVLSAPLIFRELGAEGYGLVGFYLLLQGLLPLVDVGVTAGLARAVAWHHGNGALGQVRSLVTLARRPISIFAVLLFAVFVASSHLIQAHWLGGDDLDATATFECLLLMGAALALRMPMLLDRAALGALERQVPVNAIQAAAAVARTLGALAISASTQSGALGFFAVQPVVSFLESIGYRICLRRLLTVAAEPVGRRELATHVRFSLVLAALSALWLASSQLDRLVLSAVLPLDEFGSYSLGVHLASAITLGVGAFQGAVQPRLTRLLAAGADDGVRELYGLSTAVSLSMGFTALVALIQGGALIPSVRNAVHYMDPMAIAVIYGAGNIAVALLAQVYQLQNAHGDLRLHAWVTVSQAMLLAPALVATALTGSARSTAITYAIVNAALALAWLPVVHRRFIRSSHRRWWLQDCLPPLLAGLLCVFGSLAIAPHSYGGTTAAVTITAVSVTVTLLLTGLAHHGVRREALRWWRHA
jgi:O-antigen/teichoic acid export membrane protein